MELKPEITVSGLSNKFEIATRVNSSEDARNHYFGQSTFQQKSRTKGRVKRMGKTERKHTILIRSDKEQGNQPSSPPTIGSRKSTPQRSQRNSRSKLKSPSSIYRVDSKKKHDDSLHVDSIHKLSSVQSSESKKKDRSDKASIRVVKV